MTYGDGLAERLRAAAGKSIDAFIDLFGPEYVELAVDLGIPRDRIETIASFEKAQELGVKAEGSGTASTPEVLTEMANLVASGAIEIPIAATYPLDRVAMPLPSWSNATPEERSSSSLDWSPLACSADVDRIARWPVS